MVLIMTRDSYVEIGGRESDDRALRRLVAVQVTTRHARELEARFDCEGTELDPC